MAKYFGVFIAELMVEKSQPRLAKIWATYTYLYRCLDGDDDAYEALSASGSLRRSLEELAKEYQAAFGAETCTSNEHSFYRHVIWYRERMGRLRDWSTSRYESSYGISRLCFRGGTQGTAGQILHNNYARGWDRHTCHGRRRLKLNHRQALRADDRLIFCRNEFLQISSISGDDIHCHKLRTNPFSQDFGLANELDWDAVGVRLYLGVEPASRVAVRRDEVGGKAVIVGRHILKVPKYWLYL